MAVMVVFAMLQFVLPEFAAIYQTFNTPLPVLTQRIIAIAHFSSQWGWLVGALILIAVAAYHLMKQQPYWLTLRQKLLLGFPVIGPMVRGQKLTQIFTVLALTQNAGIPFLQGLESVTETLANPFWSQRLAQVHQDISAGKPVWLALKIAVNSAHCAYSWSEQVRLPARWIQCCVISPITTARKHCLRQRIWLRYSSLRYWSLRG